VTSIKYAFLRKTGLLVVLLVALLVPFAVAYTGDSNITAAFVNDTRVDPNATIAFTVGPIFNGSSTNPVQNGWALDFDGANDDVTIGVVPELSLNKSRSITCWVIPESFANVDAIYFTDNTFGAGTHIYLGTGNEINAQFNNGTHSIGVVTASGQVSLNNFNFIAATYDFSTNNIVVYLNDTQVFNGVGTPAPLAYDYDGATIGSRSDGNNHWFNGTIDEVLVYNRTIGIGEILYSYENKVPLDQSDLELWIDFDQQVQDQSPNGNDGTINGAPVYDRSIRGKADIVLDGTGDNIQISDNANQDFQNMTLMAWINLNEDQTATTDFNLVDKNLAYSWRLDLDGQDKLQLILWDAVGTPSVRGSQNTWNTNQWYHVAVTVSGNTIQHYIDGSTDGASGTFNPPIDNSNNDVYLGSTAAAKYLNGSLDELLMFNRTLSLTEIYQAYIGIYPSDPAVVYLDMDAQVNDQSGTGNNGVLNGDPEYSDGWARVPVFTSINGQCSLVNSSTGIMTLIQDAPATPGWYNNTNVYAVTNSVQNATVPTLGVEQWQVSLFAPTNPVNVGSRATIVMLAESILTGEISTAGTFSTVSGVNFAWNVFEQRVQGRTGFQNEVISITYNNLTSFSEGTYGTTNAILVRPVTINWQMFVNAISLFGGLTILIAVIVSFQWLDDVAQGRDVSERMFLLKWLWILAIVIILFQFINGVFQ
jgi:hypothetical protein